MTTQTKITFNQARLQLAERGMILSKRDDEYRVTFTPGLMPSQVRREDVAYYSDDLEDTLYTGLDMAKRGCGGVSDATTGCQGEQS